MRIGIDARLLAYRQGGTSVYVRNLLQHLPAIAPDDSFVALPGRRQPASGATAPNLRDHPLWTPPHHPFEQWALPLELATAALDLVHSTDFIPPFVRACRSVITVHDLSFLLYPETKTPESLRYYGQIDRAVASADAIIAVSEATRHDLQRLLNVPPQRVRVVHHGVSPVFAPRPPEAVQAFCRERGLPDTFMLWVGALEPRKNLPALFRAVARATPRLPEALRTLVLVGIDGWGFDAAQQEFDRLGLAAQTVMFGPASEQELALLYNAAWVFPFPSLYEGFGLPPLEAMACGAPVLSARVSSMPEVLGDACRYFDPLDSATLATLLVELAADPNLRSDLRSAGLARAAGFRWERTAAETLAVYHEAASR